MSAASSSVQAAPGTRNVGFAAFALLLIAAVVALLAFSQMTVSNKAVAPAAGTAPAQHDHGWSSASSAESTWVISPNSAAVDAARHPSRRSVTVTPDGIKVTGARGGGLLFNGIPSTPASGGSDTHGAGGSIRGRLAQ
jgi:hypothetical protein